MIPIFLPSCAIERIISCYCCLQQEYEGRSKAV
uniref:Uncharacterized protein n=1 Tax=Rhizophora mucronata TaxID=61149 RepID=A0A2P2PJM4_RHIMU